LQPLFVCCVKTAQFNKILTEVSYIHTLQDAHNTNYLPAV